MVKRAWRGAVCAFLCGLLALVGAAAEINHTIDYQDDLAAPEMRMITLENKNYLVGMHKRETAYNPATVILSGSLFASDVEITDVSVSTAGGYFVEGENLTRYEGNYPEEAVKQQLAEQGASIGKIDRKRCGFVFTVDLSAAGLPNAEQRLNVTLKMANAETKDITVEAMTTTARLDSEAAPIYDLAYELTGAPTLVIRNDESGEAVTQLQANLRTLNYMTAEEQTGVYDQATRNALRRLCSRNDQVFSEDGVTMTLEKFIASGIAQAAPENGFLGSVLDFLKNELRVVGLSIPVWVIIAGAAGLTAIILTVVLLATRKRPATPVTVPEAIPVAPPTPAPASAPVQEADDATIDLNRVTADEPTIDLQSAPPVRYVLKIRLDYKGQFLDMEGCLSENQEAIIGRGETATFKTHPSDAAVSKQHGVFRVENGKPCYVDTSKNGTTVDERKLSMGEAFELLPLSEPPTKLIRHRMNLGDHRAYVIVYEEKPAPNYGGIVAGDPESEMTI